MIDIKFVAHDGTAHVVNVQPGVSLMEAARDNAVAGIDADCGGVCACATCHVFIAQEWIDRIPARSDTETDMLEMAEDVRETSRLACQIRLGAEHAGLVAHLPEYQR